MNIMPIQPNNNVNFGLNKTNRIRYNIFKDTKTLSDIVHLKNGKKIVINKTYDKMGVLKEKLIYLKDELGNWIKHKVKNYN